MDEATKLLREIREHAVFRPDEDDPSCLRGQLVTIAELCDAHLSRAPAEAPPREPFVVRHYSADERPVIKGNGFDGLEVGRDREEAENFVRWINAAIAEGKQP